MKYCSIFYFMLSFSISSCQTGKLTVIADINSELNEVSAIEVVPNSELFWVIEDAGNKNRIYGLSEEGSIVSSILIEQAKNEDWEDLTSDSDGNIYIGDFGNNSKKRDKFTIYKLSCKDIEKETAEASAIQFSLPKGMKSKDFESFFLLDGLFYIFSKEKKKPVLISVPNIGGEHIAKLVTEFKLKGRNTEITSADISDDGRTVVLLNHDKVWKLSGYKEKHFFEGTVQSIDFEHNSQKEGICFKNDSTVVITDERNKSESGNIYMLKL